LISSICGREQRFSQIEQALTACVSLRQITDLLEMLYLSLCNNEKRKDEFKSIIKKIRELEQKRNSIVHSVWIKMPNDEEFVKWKFAKDKNKGIKFVDEKFDINAFTSIAEDVFPLRKI
jgi:hypothetical protein